MLAAIGVNATENVTDTSQIIIDLIKEDPYISTTKMAEIIGVAGETMQETSRNYKSKVPFVE